MHPARAMNARLPTHAATVTSAPLDRQIATQAAKWFLLLHDGEASAKQQAACMAWRSANPEHERAWQRAQQVSRTAALVPADVGKAVLCRPVTSGVERRRAVKTLLLLMSAGGSGWLAIERLPWRVWNADYASATGQQRRIALPDGTQVQLNTATAIDVVFDGAQRSLLLRAGEIMVTTARDPLTIDGRAARPFVVMTAQGSVRPIGTRFNVRLQSDRSDVAVLEGAVELQARAGGDKVLLTAGHAASFSTTQISNQQAVPAGAALWTRGILAADDMRLDALLAELGRYRPGILHCDPELASLRVTGAFQVADIDGALINLAQLLSVDLRYRTRFWVTLVPKKKNS